MAFLSALLIDKSSSTPEREEAHRKKIKKATKVLNDDMLFSVPGTLAAAEKGSDDDDEATVEKSNHSHHLPIPPKPTRSNAAQLDLWKAHGDGVRPELLREKSERASLGSKMGLIVQSKSTVSIDEDGNPVKERRGWSNSSSKRKVNKIGKSDAANQEREEEDVNFPDVLSDQEVGGIHDDSTASSWNSSQGGFDHYNTWEVIRDEYAGDFGFKVAVDDEDQILPRSKDDIEDGQHGIFKILGTSAEDTNAMPHVLSPPLMDSLLNFVPDHLTHHNFWLKFSLVRDGASLNTLKRYCRAAQHTIVAIETTNGEVFGSFTSDPWRLNNKYFGTGESFLWRMRHSRNTPVHSLFEQAQLESEIDIFPYNGTNDYIQLCTSDKIAIGGGNTVSKEEESSIPEVEPLYAPAAFLEDDIYGFGFALDENLLHGTTSPSATFGNSNLINGSGSGETFDVMNLEVWGFTSAETERRAEQSEMSMFFVRESISSNLSSANTSVSSLFEGDDLSQELFYRRVGRGDENESDRDAWQYANMMNPIAGSPYMKMGFGR